jgi:N-acetylmuramoyl-L-alanine amidase
MRIVYLITMLCLLSALTTGLGVAEESALKGKKICLDAGHGGTESGAVGLNRLREKDVNLKVVLFLKDMLEKEGATVLLTRKGDENVSLGNRAKFNIDNKTDLFVSIHHNANAQMDRAQNRTESFYHYKDVGGPSEDASRDVLRGLENAFHLPDSKAYCCWAYGVLRNNGVPAILAEASYIQNPEEEERLRSDDYLKREAQAYFEGIKRFFERGTPRIRLHSAKNEPSGAVIEAIIDEPDGRALVDPTSIACTLGGKDIDFTYDIETGKLTARPGEPLPAGEYDLEIHVRNLNGGSAIVLREKVALQETAPSAPSGESAPTASKLFNGVLGGKKIIVDAEFGGDKTGERGKNGIRASDVNVRVARLLADYLKRAGATPILTRDSDKTMDNVERVLFSLPLDADFFITVGHRAPFPGYNEKMDWNISRGYWKWDDSQALSTIFARHMKDILETDEATTAPSSTWEIMHAQKQFNEFEVSPLMMTASGVDERLDRIACNRKEALSLLYGFAEACGLKESDFAHVKGTVLDAASGKPIADAFLMIDGVLPYQTEPDGKFFLKYVGDGAHRVDTYALGYTPKHLDVPVKGTATANVSIQLAKRQP